MVGSSWWTRSVCHVQAKCSFLEGVVVEEVEQGAGLQGVFGAASAVAGVEAVVEAAGVVEEGEHHDDVGVGAGFAGEVESVSFDPCPVLRAVDAVVVVAAFADDAVPQGGVGVVGQGHGVLRCWWWVAAGG